MVFLFGCIYLQFGNNHIMNFHPLRPVIRPTWDVGGLGSLGGHHSISTGEGGAGVFVAGKLFISTGLGGAPKISYSITCLYRTVREVNYLFHAESARNYLFQKNSSPPLSKLNSGPLIAFKTYIYSNNIRK